MRSGSVSVAKNPSSEDVSRASAYAADSADDIPPPLAADQDSVPPCGGHGAPPSLQKKLLYSIILYHGIFLQECLPPEHCQAGTSKQNCESAYGAMLKSMISLVQRRRLAGPGSGSEGA
jgi:hypothetical protein